jgi:hypothetical protein
MMMRQIVTSLIVALVFVAFPPASYASVAAANTELWELIAQNEDAHMTADDLAFFLVTHDYDANPKEGLVQVKMSGEICNLVPNGAAPGLADLEILN